ncbi:MAG: redoxin domain-containing protein [Candidatus Cloacimonadota bacterium]|nr:redoxin domain-containing protein [Candidatus Cloacimonadota bacterium]
MKKIILSLVFIMIISSYACSQSQNSELNWYSNLEKAQKIAQQEEKFIFIHFTGSDWCKWCWKLEEEVYEKPEFIEYVNENFVLVKLDFPRKIEQPEEVKNYNRSLAQKYQIKGFPTIQILDADGTPIEKTGYQEGGPKKYVQHLENILARYSGDYNIFEHSDFTLKDLEGNLVTLSELDKFIVLDFWATWCGPCKAEIPILQQIYNKYKKDGLTVVGISTEDVKTQKDFFKELEKNGTNITYIRLVDPDMSVTRKYGIRSIPTTFFINKEGILIHQEKGFAPEFADKFEDIIENNL